MYDGLDVTLGLGCGFDIPEPFLYLHRLQTCDTGGSALRTNSLDDAQVGTGGRIVQFAHVVTGFTGSNLLDFKQAFFLNETIQQRIEGGLKDS